MSQFQPPPTSQQLPPYANPHQYQSSTPQSREGYTHPPMPAVPSQPLAPQQPPPKKQPSSKRIFVIVGIVVVIVLGFVVGDIREQNALSDLSGNSPHNAGMSEQQYKDSTTTTTVADLDKEGNEYAGKDVHFTATILNFVKDSSGDTAGANVSDPTTFLSYIQVVFPAGTDVSQLNARDQIEVWGTDDGTSTGTNAFGATVHEVAISALYLTDQTTGYTTG